ncbi:MAG: CapA family protein [Cyclobacteriaceae bacterium]|nr:CapA family protein [Cyclobacteriaceae bacterium]UYN88198.1 MAG: CapA family protein [Cyclobacteriaceae bacterium]
MLEKALRYFFFLLVACCAKLVNGQDTARISLLFLGDIMQHETQINAALNSKTGKHEYAACFQFLKPYFQSVDLTIGNLELTLAGKPYTGYPQFSAPDELAVALKEIGIDVLVTANNHSVDRRKRGLERTIRVLDSLQFMHTGTFADTVERMNDYPLLIHKNGFRLALLNYTYGTNGIPVSKPNIVNLIDTVLIKKDLARARELQPDASIVFMHWGNEYERQPTKQQRQLAEFCFTHGAQLVIGAHPHVLQPMEWRGDENKLVAYSLGNFVSGQRPRYRDGGAMLQVELKKIINTNLSTTVIDTAYYRLQWVYRTTDAQRKFYVLPVATFESDPTNFIKDESSKLAFKTFIDDSRKLLTQYNKGVVELRTIPADTVTSYTLRVFEAANTGEVYSILEKAGSFPHGLHSEINEMGLTVFYTGKFSSWEKAMRYRQTLEAVWPNCSVVKCVNGLPVE